MESLLSKLRKSRKNILAKNNVIGNYDFHTTIVTLEYFENKHIIELDKNRNILKEHQKTGVPVPLVVYESISNITVYACHEYTHFLDCTSTLWGFRYLELMSQAYSVDNKRFHFNTEEYFYFAKEFHDFIRSIKLPNYYTEVHESNDAKGKWLVQQTLGHRFSSSGHITEIPILFMTFLNENELPLVRSPISILSLLECSAMSQEILHKISLMSMLCNTDVFKVEFQRYNDEMKKYLFNKNMTEYSVCAHFISLWFNIQDIVQIFQASSLLSRAVLNTPIDAFDSIYTKCDFLKLFNVTEEQEHVVRIKRGIKYRDLGILFYVICRALKKINADEISLETISDAFRELGVNPKELNDFITLEIETVSNSLTVSQIPSIKIIALAGLDNFKILDKANSSLIDFEKLNIPPILLGDSEETNFLSGTNNSLCNVDLNSIFEDLHQGQRWVDRFTDACM